MKNVLLPTDFSENAWNAAIYALHLFQKEACAFHLVNTYTPAIVHSRFMAVSTHGAPLEDAIREESERGLEYFSNRIKSECQNPDHSFVSNSSFNLLSEEIREAEERFDMDLIVTGTTGASGFKEVFLGSNTVRMINTVQKTPVLAVPMGHQFKKPQKIAFVSDFKRSFHAGVLHPVIQFAKAFNAHVYVMHIKEDDALDKFQQSHRNILLEYLREVHHSLHWMPNYSSKSEIIQEFLDEFDIDVLAMVKYNHSFLETLVREPVVKKVAFHTKIPLLAIPD